MSADPYLRNDPLAPIQRMTLEERFTQFQKGADEQYKKITIHDQNRSSGLSSIGFSQPFVFTNVSDSNFSKHITKYDSQAFPIGSTVLDLKRMGKYMASGPGLLFIGKQYLLQTQTAFNETRIYNPLSIIGTTVSKGSLGMADAPTRFLATDGSIGDIVAGSLKSLVGLSGDAMTKKPKGAASRKDALSDNAMAGGQSPVKGLIRFDTGQSAISSFNVKWAGGEKKKSSLIDKLKSFLPKTMPFGYKGSDDTWGFRPEYKDPKNGPYEMFFADKNGLLSFASTGKGSNYGWAEVRNLQRYSPKGSIESLTQYFTPEDQQKVLSTNLLPTKNTDFGRVGIDVQRKLMESVSEAWTDGILNQNRNSVERYTNIKDKDGRSYPAYSSIGKTFTSTANGIPKVDDTFSTSTKNPQQTYIGSEDKINVLLPFDGTRSTIEKTMSVEGMNGQSKDVIYFYFYDVINEKYIPFRATISGLNEVNSADWDDVQYIGRADKLYLYKGYTRSLNFNFTIYANSLKELVPMWLRLNYLVGLTRPSKYTGNGFMYPPMVEIRIGDMYNEQPGIIRSISMTIPDEVEWETYRGYGSTFNYLKGFSMSNGWYQNGINYPDSAKSLQLPKKIDVAVTMDLMEKEKSSILNDSGDKFIDHYNLSDGIIGGNGPGTKTKSNSMLAKEASLTSNPDPNLTFQRTSFSVSTSPFGSPSS